MYAPGRRRVPTGLRRAIECSSQPGSRGSGRSARDRGMRAAILEHVEHSRTGERPLSRQISQWHPWLYEARSAELRLERRLSDRIRRVPFAATVAASPLPVTLARHASVLRRRLRDLDPRLQETKIVNLRLAAAAMDGLLIRPGETFSFWNRVGPPTAARGFAEGLILRGGRITAGIGGGLCQLSNLLYWMALHTPLEVVEQHHHGFDPFPDAGRVLPFGSGATIFWNYGDLRLANPTDQALQLCARVGTTRLHGAVRSERPWPVVYHVEEVGHRFVREADGVVYRENELWRRSVDRRTGETLDRTLITRNHAVVAYPVPHGLAEAASGPAGGASLAGDGGLRAR
jgi:vancomycin resistance protein VanW